MTANGFYHLSSLYFVSLFKGAATLTQHGYSARQLTRLAPPVESQRRPTSRAGELQRARGRPLGAARCATYVENKAGVASQPEQSCQLAEAGRGWPRLEAALRLIWRRWGVRAGGRMGRGLRAAVFHMARRHRGASTRCREQRCARPRTRAPRSAQAAPRRW